MCLYVGEEETLMIAVGVESTGVGGYNFGTFQKDIAFLSQFHWTFHNCFSLFVNSESVISLNSFF